MLTKTIGIILANWCRTGLNLVNCDNEYDGYQWQFELSERWLSFCTVSQKSSHFKFGG